MPWTGAVAFCRWRAADVRSMLTAGAWDRLSLPRRDRREHCLRDMPAQIPKVRR